MAYEAGGLPQGRGGGLVVRLVEAGELVGGGESVLGENADDTPTAFVERGGDPLEAWTGDSAGHRNSFRGCLLSGTAMSANRGRQPPPLVVGVRAIVCGW